MKRATFARALALAPFLGLSARLRARAQNEDADPATMAQTPSLRVLLGRGSAAPLLGGGFQFGGRAYRGAYRITADGSIVNIVDIEQYLYSVVPREMPPHWPAAALQAQAVCARTYVLQRSNPRREYDVVPSELDQVYGGVEAESPACRDAVDATAGQILQFAGEDVYALYSSCCGGHTESSADAWGGVALPYLMGVACSYCTESPNYRWQREVPLATVARAFQTELAPLGALTGVRIAERDASGRASSVELDATGGSSSVKGSAFRISVGSRTVPSLLIAKMDVMVASSCAPQASTTLALEGGGLGHGVGLCQWGARGMALMGRSTSEILALYFPGTELSHD